MPKYFLLIDYEFCVGCRACELACKQEHNRPDGEWGMYVQEIETETADKGPSYIPFPTDKCNLCGRRIAKGLQPACVHNCWAKVIKFGEIEEIAQHVKEKPGIVVWAPK